MFSNMDKPKKYVLFLFKLLSKMLILDSFQEQRFFFLAFSKSLVLCDGSKMINFE